MSWSRRKVVGTCSVAGCEKPIRAKGFCAAHYTMNRKFGRTHRVVRLYDGQLCAYPECKEPARVCGYCRSHYKVARREGLLHPGKYKRDHPLYALWWDRRKANELVQEWADDFWKFVSDIKERPKNHTLVRLRLGAFGPDNVLWKPHLIREKGESLKSWRARKWQARKQANPGWDNERKLNKLYGLSREQYSALLAEQDGLCAVCHGPEKKIEHRTGVLRSFAVDHNHETGKVRGLLCSRCNMVMGQLEESVDLLHDMIKYLEKHSITENRTFRC
jgi:Recombination endonuclease VII